MKKQKNSVSFSSTDSRFQMILNMNDLIRILTLYIESHKLETGGILIGHYTRAYDQAVVTKVIEAPEDSLRSNNAFIRGNKGLKKILDLMWPKNSYYLGEWHFHPFSSSEPSSQDMAEMEALSNLEKLHCPEPILLIIGGNLEVQWEVSAFVFPRNQKHVQLELQNLPSVVRLKDRKLNCIQKSKTKL